jgi:hypothetical protein
VVGVVVDDELDELDDEPPPDDVGVDGAGAAATVMVISAELAGVPETPCAVKVSVYWLFDVVLVFAGTVTDPEPGHVLAAGSVSPGALDGSEVADSVQL